MEIGAIHDRGDVEPGMHERVPPGFLLLVVFDTPRDVMHDQAVEDDDCNVMCLGARIVGPELAIDLVRTNVRARFSGLERHKRRLEKIKGFERESNPYQTPT